MTQTEPSAETPAPDGFTQPNGLPAVPIVIGIVGHRGIRKENREDLKGKLKTVFEDFRKAYPSTPLVVLSALAEGADQVAARAAIAAGAFVRAPLPFSPDVYRQSTSFGDEDARVELDDLLTHDQVEWFVVPLPEGKAPAGRDWLRVASDRDDPACKELRYTCYANAGGYITRRCHVLIAMQDERDGGKGRGPSGTAEYVAFKLTGEPPGRYPWAFAEPLGYRNERRLVMTIDTPRDHPANEDGSQPHLLTDRNIGEPRVLVPSSREETWAVPPKRLPLARRISSWSRFWARCARSLGFGEHPPAHDHHEKPGPRIRAELRQFRETCTNIDDFNRDVANPGIAAKVHERLNDESRFRVPQFDDQHNRWLVRLSRIREAAASVSGHLQPQLDRAVVFVIALLGASILAFHYYAHKFGYDRSVDHSLHNPIYLAVFLVLLVTSFAIVAVAWWRRLDERRLDARALAEGLRVRREWAMAGISASVADSYSGQVRNEMSWIRQALLHTCPPPQVWASQFQRLSPDDQLAILERVRSGWVEGQIKQHEAGHRKNHGWARRLRRLGFLLALASWMILAGILTSAWWVPWWEAHNPWHHPQGTVAQGQADPPESAPEPENHEQPHPPPSAVYPSHDILIWASMLVILGGLFIALCERQAYEELSKQYEHMAILFANGNHELKKRLAARNVEGAQQTIGALGREAIIEHAQWLVLRRARQLELHIGG